MIHQLLSLTRPLFVFDVETTGLDVNTDHIVEIGFQRFESSGLTLEYRTLVNPGIPIPEAVTKIHHITDVIVKNCRVCGGYNDDVAPDRCKCPAAGDDATSSGFKPWPTFAQLAPRLAKGFTSCDFAGKNVRFDLRILDAEMRRAHVAWSYAGARIIDADRLEALAVPRHLSNLYEKYTGNKLEDAHQALADVRATTAVIEAQIQTHQTLPRDLDVLHEAQWPGWIDGAGKFRFVDGVPCFTGWGKYANKPMRIADVGYWDFILKNDFAEDVKQLARDAKLRKYPEAR